MAERVRILGRSGTPAVLLLHGSIGPGATEPLAHSFASRFRVALPALPGFLPGDAPHGYDEVALIEWVDEMRTDLGVDRMYVAGMGSGGRLALAYACARPSHVDRIVLFAPAGFDEPSAWNRHAFVRRRRTGRLARRLADRAAAESYLLEGFVGRSSDVARRAAAQFVEMVADAGIRGTVAGTVVGSASSSPAWRGRLAQVKAPTLILWGSDDRSHPVSGARKLADALPAATVEILRGFRHLAVLEEPRLVEEHVFPFLNPMGGKQLPLI